VFAGKFSKKLKRASLLDGTRRSGLSQAPPIVGLPLDCPLNEGSPNNQGEPGRKSYPRCEKRDSSRENGLASQLAPRNPPLRPNRRAPAMSTIDSAARRDASFQRHGRAQLSAELYQRQRNAIIYRVRLLSQPRQARPEAAVPPHAILRLCCLVVFLFASLSSLPFTAGLLFEPNARSSVIGELKIGNLIVCTLVVCCLSFYTFSNEGIILSKGSKEC